jgi:hypothetical protein
MCKPNIYIVERSRKRWDSDMTVYWVVNFDLRAGSGNKYLEWLKSEEAQKIRRKIEEETGAKYVGTYIQEAGGTPFDFEEWWEFPNYVSYGKFRESNDPREREAWRELTQKIYPMIEMEAAKSRLLRPVHELERYRPTANQ